MNSKEEKTDILNKLSREVVTNSRGYKATKSALEWYEKNQDLDSIDAFEAGFETGWDAAIDKACEFIQTNVREYHKSGVFHVADFIKDIKKVMDE